MINKFIVTTALSAIMAVNSPLFAQKTSDSGVVIAKIDGNPIYKEELKKIEQAYSPETLKQAKDQDGQKFFSNLRDQAIDIKLLMNESAKNFDMKVFKEALEKANLKKDPEISKMLVQAAEQVTLQSYITQNVNKTMNDKAIKEEYDQFIKDFPKDEMEVHVRHILLKTESEAKQVIQELKKGGDFQKIARDKSIDKISAAEGGDLGFIHKGRLDPSFTEAVFALKVGGFSETPVKTPIGWHVLKADDKRKIKAPKFEEIKEQLSNAVFQKQLKKTVENLRDKASIERFDENGKSLSTQDSKAASKESNNDKK